MAIDSPKAPLYNKAEHCVSENETAKLLRGFMKTVFLLSLLISLNALAVANFGTPATKIEIARDSFKYFVKNATLFSIQSVDRKQFTMSGGKTCNDISWTYKFISTGDGTKGSMVTVAATVYDEGFINFDQNGKIFIECKPETTFTIKDQLPMGGSELTNELLASMKPIDELVAVAAAKGIVKVQLVSFSRASIKNLVILTVRGTTADGTTSEVSLDASTGSVLN